MNTELKKYYDEIYSKKLYNEEGVFSSLDNGFIDAISNTFSKEYKGNALDLGYGAGNYSLYLLKQGYEVTAVDFVEPEIFDKKLPDKFKKKCNIICSDLNNYSFNEKFDLIISKDVLHYLNKKTVEKLIKMSAKNTIIGGINYLTMFTNIKRVDKHGNIKKINDEAEFQLKEFLDLLSDVYTNWNKNITISDYFEKDKHDKNRNYFEAKKVVLIARKG